MEDQVCRVEAFGIKAVAINMASSQQDAGLVDRILNGQFEPVFVSPEWCVPVTLGLSCNRSVGRIKGNQATFR